MTAQRLTNVDLKSRKQCFGMDFTEAFSVIGLKYLVPLAYGSHPYLPVKFDFVSLIVKHSFTTSTFNNTLIILMAF